MVRDKFESRTLTNQLTVVAILNYLNENFEGEKPLQVTLTIEPRRVDETDYCSRKGEEIKEIEVRGEKEISEITHFLLENVYVDKIHVVIE